MSENVVKTNKLAVTKKDDFAYTTTKVQGDECAAWMCSLAMPCLQLKETFDTDEPATGPGGHKKSQQVCAMKAMQKLYAQLYRTVTAAHKSGAGCTGGASGESAESSCKMRLTDAVQAISSTEHGRGIQAGDLIFQTELQAETGSYTSSLKLMLIDGGARVYTSMKAGASKKQAENDASRKALEANKKRFEEAAQALATKKAADKEAKYAARAAKKGEDWKL